MDAWTVPAPLQPCRCRACFVIWPKSNGPGSASGVPTSELPPLFDPDLGKDHDFEATDPEHAAEDLALWLTETQLAVDAVRDLPFEHILSHHGEPMSLRMVHLHMIGEYARHNGHADLLREAIDGVTAR